MADDEEVADEEVTGDISWELRHLDADSGVPFGMLPSAEQLKSLCKQLRDKFTLNQQGTGERTSPNDLFYWACRSLEIDPNQYDHENAIQAVKREHFRIQRLRIAVEEHVVMDEDCMTILENALRVVTSAERFLLQAGRLFVYASDTKDQSALAMLPKQIRVETEFMKGSETILDYDETKLDHFQKLFLDLRMQLEAAHYRRAEGKFFSLNILSNSSTLQMAGKKCTCPPPTLSRPPGPSPHFSSGVCVSLKYTKMGKSFEGK